MTMTAPNVAVVHPMYGGDDIIASNDWDDILFHVAIDWDDEKVLFLAAEEAIVNQWCIDHGYTPIPASLAFEYRYQGNRPGYWVRLQHPESNQP